MIADDRTQSMWPMLAQYSKKPKYDLPDPSDSLKVTPFSCILSQSALSQLLHSDTSIYSEISEKISDKRGAGSFRFSGEIKFSIIQNEDIRSTNNIVGVIPGIDPELKNEYIAIGAHYDHLGISDGTVFNGADDDGSGTVGVMEVAKAFAQQRNNKRSILVVLHAAEEEGLFGSQYLTDNIKIIDDIVAHVNLDMIGRESIDTLYSVGSDKLSSELKTLVEEVNQETVNFVLNYKLDDPNDPERVFYRSDHYNYAKHGIPIVFFSDNMQIDYHKPTDDYDKIDFDKIKKTSELVYSLVARLANLDHRLVVDKENK